MGIAIDTGSIKYVFTQATAPSGEGEVQGSLWYDTVNKKLYTYDGSSWLDVSVASAGEGHILIDINSGTVSSGAWVFAQSTNYVNNYSAHNSNGNNDQLTYKCYLAKGTYTLTVIGERSTSKGITKFYIDTDLIATLDWYGATLSNHKQTTTSITVTSDGLYDLIMDVDGKNGSSSTYWVFISSISLVRTA